MKKNIKKLNKLDVTCTLNIEDSTGRIKLTYLLNNDLSFPKSKIKYIALLFDNEEYIDSDEYILELKNSIFNKDKNATPYKWLKKVCNKNNIVFKDCKRALKNIFKVADTIK